MSIQLICENGAVVEFPKEYHPYSEVIQRMMDNDEEEGSCSEDEDENDEVKVEHIIVKESQESVKLSLAILEMLYAKDPNNILPPETPKKVTAPNFKIEETIDQDVVEFFKEAGKDGVFAMTKVGDFLGIKLITHLCFTWIAHNLNTQSTKERMSWLGISGEAPTFEEIMEVDLKTGYIPSMNQNQNNGGGGSK
jgi:hypothetical protein